MSHYWHVDVIETKMHKNRMKNVLKSCCFYIETKIVSIKSFDDWIVLKY